jgi:branched-subunit amino acid aminotransferase/4-amino-4-deoxychorismate lyase
MEEEIKSGRIKILESEEEIITELKSRSTDISSNIVSFYNGALKAIITNRAFMQLHLMDKLIQYSYGVFDTCHMEDNQLYNLENHLDRFFNSMEIAKIQAPLTRSKTKEILLTLASTAKHSPLHLRFWASRGGFTGDITTPTDCPSILYALAIKLSLPIFPPTAICVTSPLPPKPHYLAQMKTTNYLLNCLAGDYAKQSGAFPVILDQDGCVTEAHIFGLGFVLEGGVYYTPAYTAGVLRSTTNDRVICAIKQAMQKEGAVIKEIRREPFLKAHFLKHNALEMMLLGADTVIRVTKWDDVDFSTRGLGITQIIQQMFLQDHQNQEVLTQVP